VPPPADAKDRHTEGLMIERFAPMLATRGEPFDSPDYLFEVKWNDIRALAARDSGR
jgi:hypothetical protein